MATERQVHFRVGMLVIIAIGVCVGLSIQFGDIKHRFKRGYPLTVQLENSAGLYPAAPVTLSGLSVGSVQSIKLHPKRGVNITIEIHDDIILPIDSQVVVARSLMGDAALEIIRGTDDETLSPGDTLVGASSGDPLAMLQRLEIRTSETLSAFAETGQEWRQVAHNLNALMDTERGNLDQVVERAAETLFEFTNTMKTANRMMEAANGIVADPATQRAMKDSLTALPKLVFSTKAALDETKLAVTSTRQVLESLNRNLVSLSQVTEPIGQRGEKMVAKLDSSLTNVDQLLNELTRFARALNQKDGSIQKLVTDSSLYDNLDRSSQSLLLLMKNLEPVMRDLREFSDKLARNPELIGAGGVVRPSSGLKDEEVIGAGMKRPAKPAPQLQKVRANGTN